MRKLFLWAVLSLFILGSAMGATAQTNDTKYYRVADSLVKEYSYFKARDYLQANARRFSAFHSLLLWAATDNAFNRPAASNQKINTLLTQYAAQLSDAARLNLLRLKATNHARLFEYEEARDATREILEKYPLEMESTEVIDFENSLEIWEDLTGSPAMRIEKKGTSTIQMTRDKAKLANLTIRKDTISVPFIFDTGANLCTVTQTTAKRMGMQLMDAEIEVGSITGNSVTARLALCPEFSIDNITVYNAVFLVFDDTSMAFSQISYQINGIIGFPVIEALKEITITKKDEFIVPEKPSNYKEQNMALQFLSPILALGNAYFTFDTGATSTSLYKKYYDAHPEIIKGATEADVRSGGLGGATTKRGYKVTYSPVIQGKKITLPGVDMFTDVTITENKYYYGNIGQDVIKQFSAVTLNFQDMFIRFE